MEFNARIAVCCFVLMYNLLSDSFSVDAESDNMGGELNYSCATAKDCRYFGYVCKANVCQCDQWYIPDKEKKKCLGGIDQKCLYDEHCIDGAFCMNQAICRCKHSTSQPLEHGLVCAGVGDLRQHFTGATLVVIGIFINIFGGAHT